MAKISTFEYPEIGLHESVELARRIYDDLGGDIRRDGLAIVLGMSPTGGAFGTRINALRMWGLVERRGDLKLTKQGIQISTPTSPAEELDAMRKLAASVPLFNELHVRLGDANVDQNVLTVVLQEITGVELHEVMRRVPIIERIFNSIRGLLNESQDYIAPESDQSEATTTDTGPLPKGWIEFRYEDGALRMRETVTNLDVLIGTLESRRDRLINN